MKKVLAFSLFLAVLFGMAVFSFSGCSGNVDKPKYDDGIAIEPLRGDEQTVTILADTSMNIGAGYTDITLPNRSAILGEDAAIANGLFNFLFTRALHNYNITNNKIRLNYLDWGWGDELTQKLTNVFLANGGANAPDIIIGESQLPAYMNQGLLHPFPDDLAAKIRNTMLPVAYQVMEKDGKIYGLAPNPSVELLIWNKDVLRKTGVDQKYIDAAPATWEEFLDVCETVRKNGKGTYFAGGPYLGANYGGYLRAAPFLLQAGGGYVDSSGKPYFNSEGNKTALEMLREVAQYNSRAALTPNSEEVMYNQFNRGRYAYIVDGSWRATMARNQGLDVGYGKLPSPDGTSNINMTIGACYLCVPSYVEDPTNAFKVIESHIEKSVQDIIADIDIKPISFMEIGESEDYKTRSPMQFYAYELMKGAELYSLPSWETDSDKIWQAFGAAMVQAVSTKEDVDIAALLQTAQDSVYIV